MSLPAIAGQRPVLLAVCCAVLQFLVTTLILKAGMAFAPAAAFGQVKLVAFASTIVLPLLLVQVFGLWRQVGFQREKARPGWFFAASLLLCVMFVSMGVRPQAEHPAGMEVLIQFLNAFGEELLFRGLIFALLLPLKKWKAIVLSGVLFGCMHLIHGFMDGNWNHAMWWALATCLSGMMFAAVRYETGSLWLTIILHMVLNLSKIYSNIDAAAGPAALLVAERAAYGLELALVLYAVFRAGTHRRQAAAS